MNKTKQTELKVHCGPMFAGKTTQMLRDCSLAQAQGKKVLIFKPAIDTRYELSDVVSHDGVAASDLGIQTLVKPTDWMLTDEDTELVMGESVLVGIDEAQFFTNIDRIVIDFQSLGCSVVCSGLDLDSFGSSFGKMGELLCLANVVVKHKASCAQCSDPATKTFRKITASTEKVLIGGTDLYEPRCHEHWMQGISTWEKAMKKVL